ncbi:MAG TPA: hypothetical protein VEV84_07505 [Pyrinomonadaceae bacterium]|nr:hypothetical protein [Pyrinomonadaceae bacterium]
MKKIIVIGSSGAGKTHFSSELSERLGIELVHIDKIYWQPGWTEPSKDEWKAKLAEILKGDAWIIDGNYTATVEMRLAACDTAIFLDIRRTLCMWRVIRRTFRFFRRSRPDMADGCREWLDFQFLLFVWNYPKVTRPRIMTMLKAAEPTTRIIYLRSPREVKQFLKGLKREPVSPQVYPLTARAE